MSYPVTRLLVQTPLTPNQITAISLVLGIGGVLPYLLAPAAIGSQVYWGLQFAKAARRWHV